MVKDVYLFVGDEARLKDIALENLKSTILHNNLSPLDLNIFYAESTGVKEVIACANTIPFISPKRLVILKGIESLRHEDKLIISEYAKAPRKTTCLVLETDEKAIPPEFHPSSRHIEIKRFDKLDGDRLHRFIGEFTNSHGKKIEGDAIRLLIDLLADNLNIVTKEVEKLITYIGSRDTITFEDVEKLVEGGALSSTFDLADAIGAKRVNEALRISKDLLMKGRKYHEIVGLLCWHLRRILKARELLDAGKGDKPVTAILYVPERFKEKFISQVKKYGREELESKLETILKLDLDIKMSSLKPRVLLEIAIIRLCL